MASWLKLLIFAIYLEEREQKLSHAEAACLLLLLLLLLLHQRRHK
jgi:hypothetical protein